MTAILEKARAEGYAAGRADAKLIASHLREMDRADAYVEGFYEARAKAPSRYLWWLFGVVCGLIPLVWSLTQ